MNFDISTLRDILLSLIIVACSLALHEWGHAIVADLLGDNTPRSQGRLTLNPASHIDPIGTLLVPLLGALGVFGQLAVIGWAKPIETNPSRYKNRYRDMALVTIAGPAMNALIALLATVIAALLSRFYPKGQELMFMILSINVSLVVFNMLPIPPLDGSKFFIYWFGMSEETYMNISRWSGFALLILINIPAFRGALGSLIQIASVPFAILYGLLT
jgi:Zn-dependent protease